MNFLSSTTLCIIHKIWKIFSTFRDPNRWGPGASEPLAL